MHQLCGEKPFGKKYIYMILIVMYTDNDQQMDTHFFKYVKSQIRDTPLNRQAITFINVAQKRGM